MSSSGPRGSYAKGRARRQEILRVALEAYAGAGPHGVTLREIALRAGVTETGLLHHFGSKEELLTAVLAARDDDARSAFGDAMDAEHLRRLVQYNTSTSGLVRLFVAVVADASQPGHPAHDAVRARYRRVLTSGAASLDRQLRTAPLPSPLAQEDLPPRARVDARNSPSPPLPPSPGPAPEPATPGSVGPTGSVGPATSVGSGGPTGPGGPDAGPDDAAWMSRILVAAMDGLQLQWLLDDTVDMASDISRLHAALIGAAAQVRSAAGEVGAEAARRPARGESIPPGAPK